VELKKPWNYLHELAKENRGETAAGGIFPSNTEMWCLLEKVRTYYQENTD
jgi:hypothetical protein